MFDICMNLPKYWIFNFNKTIKYDRGELDVIEPSEYDAIVTLLWYPLSEVVEIYSRGRNRGIFKSMFKHRKEERRELSNEVVLSIYRDKVISRLMKELRGFNLLRMEKKYICNHMAYYDEMVFESSSFRLFHRTTVKALRVQYLFICDESKRLFALYLSTLEKSFKKYEKCFEDIVRSFRCH